MCQRFIPKFKDFRHVAIKNNTQPHTVSAPVGCLRRGGVGAETFST